MLSEYLKHFLWSVVMPSSWLWYTIVYVLYLLHKGRIGLAKRVLIFWIGLIGFITLVPVGDFFLAPLENLYTLKPTITKPKVIVLLGGSENLYQSKSTGLSHLNGFATRYITTIQLAQKYPNAKIIISGGAGHTQFNGLSESIIGKHILLTAGIDNNRIVVEDQSRSTVDNALFTKLLVDKLHISNLDTVVLVTTASHMPRAMGLFCHVGFTSITPYPTDYKAKNTLGRISFNFAQNLIELNFAIHEWLGLFFNWITGKTQTLLVKSC